jgi:DNA-binding NarL/FixJ family response regulator
MAGRGNILIVDDDVEFVAGLQQTIEQYNYHVVPATNKTEAQQIMRTTKPDLIILGTIAPRGNAFLFHNWLKRNQNFNSLPIIIIDAAPEKQLIKGWTKDEGLRLEAEGYLCKPLNPSALLAFINKLLDKQSKKIKVLVADDHAIAREGIRTLLNLQKDIEIVGEAVDGREAVSKVHKLAPDIVLMDIVMPGVDGLEATRRISKECNRTKVLILSQYYDEDSKYASYQAGAMSFIPKNSASSQLITAIRKAHQYLK